ncbi:hypothetical protein [Abditibacterium utsteinense]|uniref:hypothetical protein n=1 Tax=Abditibacterium utsteinense TaxID=1960156 RepID=UPI000CFB3D09|nr:hypothetical protein [Abditibacterium utsteinense]
MKKAGGGYNENASCYTAKQTGSDSEKIRVLALSLHQLFSGRQLFCRGFLHFQGICEESAQCDKGVAKPFAEHAKSFFVNCAWAHQILRFPFYFYDL